LSLATSSMKLAMGSAFWGWNAYECGELSIMIICDMSRPRLVRSVDQGRAHSIPWYFRGVRPKASVYGYTGTR